MVYHLSLIDDEIIRRLESFKGAVEIWLDLLDDAVVSCDGAHFVEFGSFGVW